MPSMPRRCCESKDSGRSHSGKADVSAVKCPEDVERVETRAKAMVEKQGPNCLVVSLGKWTRNWGQSWKRRARK